MCVDYGTPVALNEGARCTFGHATYDKRQMNLLSGPCYYCLLLIDIIVKLTRSKKKKKKGKRKPIPRVPFFFSSFIFFIVERKHAESELLNQYSFLNFLPFLLILCWRSKVSTFIFFITQPFPFKYQENPISISNPQLPRH